MFIFIYLFTSVKLHFFSFSFMVSLTSDCWSTSLYGIMGKTDKYSAFMCRVLFVFHFWERKKRTRGKVAAKREALNAFTFRPVF